MKKPIALPILLSLVLLTSSLASLPAYLEELYRDLDRNILCAWLAGHKGRHMLDAVAKGEPSCPPVFPAPTDHYRENCIRKCDPLAIVDQVFESAKQTVADVKDEMGSMFYRVIGG